MSSVPISASCLTATGSSFDCGNNSQDYYSRRSDYNKYDRLTTLMDSLEVPTYAVLYRSNMSETSDSRIFGSTYSGVSCASSFDSDNIAFNRSPLYSGFLVSFLVDARGGSMRGRRHTGMRIMVPPGCASMPTRVTCKFVRKEKITQLPALTEGEALACRVLIMGPAGAKFLGPVALEVPHYASLRSRDREIVVLRSDDGQTWCEHRDVDSIAGIEMTLSRSFEDVDSTEALQCKRITRIVTADFPRYFSLVTRVRQSAAFIGSAGGSICSLVDPRVSVDIPSGALTRNVKIGLQVESASDHLLKTASKYNVDVSSIVSVEPRCRKFRCPITLTVPLPFSLGASSHERSIMNDPCRLDHLHLLCSITRGESTNAEWEDITNATHLTVVNNNCLSFTTDVSASYWLVSYPPVAVKTEETILQVATSLYSASYNSVPFIANLVVFARKGCTEVLLRIYCVTDDRVDKTLEIQEKFLEIARSEEIEVLDGEYLYVNCTGNLELISTSSDQQDNKDEDNCNRLNFHVFRENRLTLAVCIKDVCAEPTGQLLFTTQPNLQKRASTSMPSLPPPPPLCTLAISLTSLVSISKEKFDYSEPALRLQDMIELTGIEDQVKGEQINVITQTYLQTHDHPQVMYNNNLSYDVEMAHLLSNAAISSKQEKEPMESADYYIHSQYQQSTEQQEFSSSANTDLVIDAATSYCTSRTAADDNHINTSTTTESEYIKEENRSIGNNQRSLTVAEQSVGTRANMSSYWMCGRDGEEMLTSRLVLKKEVRKLNVLIDGREDTIISEHLHLIQDNKEPIELTNSVQNIIAEFMNGGRHLAIHTETVL